MSDAETVDRDKAVTILAKSLMRTLRQNGYEKEHLIALLSELAGLVADSIRSDGAAE